jgi:histidyl-tRNA synthetase
LFVNFGEQEENFILPILAQLRNAGVNAEIYPEAAKLKKQLAYADTNKIPYVILAGESEIADGKLTLKNMLTGEQKLVTVEELPNCQF